MHTHQSSKSKTCPAGTLTYAGSSAPVPVKNKTTYKQAKQNGIEAMQETFPGSECSPGCLESQLDAYHKQANINDDTEVKAVVTGGTNLPSQEYASGWFSP